LNLTASNTVVNADRIHLTNILHNLVDNAVKYTRDHPVIQISLHDGPGKKLILAIQDNGIGIAREHQRRVFDKFYRVPTGNLHNVKGFGLGLFYVKTVCKQHKWHLEMDSKPGEGTIIRIIMPSQA
ncbi:MAG: hypothetical protein RLZ62_2492, partial [Bacteroidota bacterium]